MRAAVPARRASPRLAAAPAPITIDQVALQWSNAYLIRKPGGAVLIDAGSPGDRDALTAALAARDVALSVKAVVVTHAHADHADGVRWLQTQPPRSSSAPATERSRRGGQ